MKVDNENGLVLERDGRASRTACGRIDDPRGAIRENFTAASGVIWLVDRVLFIRVAGDRIETADGSDPFAGSVQEARVFDEDKELHLWTGADGALTGRLCRDGSGDPCAYVDAWQVLLGTVSAVEGDWTRLSEERYADLVIPGAFPGVDPATRRVAVRTRNYVDHDANGIAGYVDHRFVAFGMTGGA